MNWERCDQPPETPWESCDGAGVPESDIRERQPEFATPTHEVVGASIIRRPDAISLDYLTAHTLGPIAVADPSRGLVARAWKAWTPDGYEVRLAGANGAGDAWTYEVLLFTIDDGGPPILELDIAFEQNGQPVVCLERATGVGGASEVWIWFYDPTVPGMVLRNFGAGRTPRALLDRPIEIADSDAVVFYVADHLGRIAYRQQRDRYAVEIPTPFEATEDTFLEDAAKMQDRRVVLILSERDQISGTYSLRTATTTLFPLAADTEAVEPIHGITAATLEQVFRWLDTQMRPEAIEPVHSLVSARLQEPIILYTLAGEAIEPAHSLTGITLRDLILVYAATTEAVAPAYMIAHATLVVAITIDRVLDTEAVEPAHTITSIELQAA